MRYRWFGVVVVSILLLISAVTVSDFYENRSAIQQAIEKRDWNGAIRHLRERGGVDREQRAKSVERLRDAFLLEQRYDYAKAYSIVTSVENYADFQWSEPLFELVSAAGKRWRTLMIAQSNLQREVDVLESIYASGQFEIANEHVRSIRERYKMLQYFPQERARFNAIRQQLGVVSDVKDY
ncbi:MAG: hypothetical protein ACRC5C_15030, partial [Bacilli bacterium]